MGKNNLFSEPVITSSEDFDKDYTLDNNGVDIDPDNESLLKDEDKTNNTGLKEESIDKVDNQETTNIDNQPLNEEDIFKTEEVPTTENVKRNRVINSRPIQEAPISAGTNTEIQQNNIEYEDEPKKSSSPVRKYIILGVIAALIAFCAGWFLFSLVFSANKEETTTNNEIQEQTDVQKDIEKDLNDLEEDVKNHTTTTPSTGTNQNQSTNNNNSSTNNSTNNGGTTTRPAEDTPTYTPPTTDTGTTDTPTTDTDSGNTSTDNTDSGNNDSANDNYQVDSDAQSDSSSQTNSSDHGNSQGANTDYGENIDDYTE